MWDLKSTRPADSLPTVSVKCTTLTLPDRHPDPATTTSPDNYHCLQSSPSTHTLASLRSCLHIAARGENKNFCFENALIPIAPLLKTLQQLSTAFGGGGEGERGGEPTSTIQLHALQPRQLPPTTLATFQKAPFPPLQALEHAVPAAWEVLHLANCYSLGSGTQCESSQCQAPLPCIPTRTYNHKLLSSNLSPQ